MAKKYEMNKMLKKIVTAKLALALIAITLALGTYSRLMANTCGDGEWAACQGVCGFWADPIGCDWTGDPGGVRNIQCTCEWII